MEIGLEEIKLRQKISKLWDELDALNGFLIVTRDYLDEKKDDDEECYMDLVLDVIKCIYVLVEA